MVSSAGVEQFDRHLTTPDQARADRDQSVVVGVDHDVTTVMAGPADSRVILEVGSFGDRSATHRRSRHHVPAGDQHGVVRTDPPRRSGQPAEQVGVRRSPVTGRATAHHGGRVTAGQDDRMARELDAGDGAALVGRKDVHSPVDRRESSRRRPRSALRGEDARHKTTKAGMRTEEITVGTCASTS